MSTNLSRILPPENIVLDLDVSSKNRVFEQAGLIFENNCGIPRSLVTENLLARESMGSTGLGYGVAVPHGRIEGLKIPYAAFVRLSTPIAFGSPDGKPVNLLFFLLIPFGGGVCFICLSPFEYRSNNEETMSNVVFFPSALFLSK